MDNKMKYIDAERLKAEIERLKSKYRHNGLWTSSFQSDLAMAKIESMNELLSFLDTLEEPVSDNLEEAAIDFADNARKALYSKYYAISSIADYDHGCIDGFKAGAEWQAEQMMKEQPEVDLEKASRNVYESWMGGTMNEVRMDMVELGKALNARKEDKK